MITFEAPAIRADFRTGLYTKAEGLFQGRFVDLGRMADASADAAAIL